MTVAGVINFVGGFLLAGWAVHCFNRWQRWKRIAVEERMAHDACHAFTMALIEAGFMTVTPFPSWFRAPRPRSPDSPVPAEANDPKEPPSNA